MSISYTINTHNNNDVNHTTNAIILPYFIKWYYPLMILLPYSDNDHTTNPTTTTNNNDNDNNDKDDNNDTYNNNNNITLHVQVSIISIIITCVYCI